MKLKAEPTTVDGVEGWMLNGQKTWTTSAHFADWYWVGARTNPDAPKWNGITLFLVPMNHENITITGIWTMGDERTNEVFIDDVFVHDDYVVGEVGKGFQYISQALDLERFTMFTFSPMEQRLDLLTAAHDLMHPDAPFVQFTYAVVPPIPARCEAGSYTADRSNRVWLNLPPARVWVYRRP